MELTQGHDMRAAAPTKMKYARRLMYGAALATAIVSALLSAAPPATSQPDLSSPRAALKSLYDALVAQDGQVVYQTFYAANDQERELARAFADVIIAARKLGEAAKDKYGAAGDPLGSGMMSREEFDRLSQAEVQENGETATLVPAGQSKPVHFHRTGQRWQIVVRDFANAESDLPYQVSLLKKVAAVFTEVAVEISAGKYQTSPEAEAVIKTKLAGVMIKAATQAATRSAASPPTPPTAQQPRP
jgi:hypothetical protein